MKETLASVHVEGGADALRRWALELKKEARQTGNMPVIYISFAMDPPGGGQRDVEQVDLCVMFKRDVDRLLRGLP